MPAIDNPTIIPQPLQWDIFCNVIDNYGDIGVTWRLARQLVAEHSQKVQLWVDDLAALAMMCPEADASSNDQRLAGVRVRRWEQEWPPDGMVIDDMVADGEIANVVIEAFGCTIPPAYIVAMNHVTMNHAAMNHTRPPVLWLNLEYLSAEPWVEGCHGLPSKLANNLQKYFFFPGFSAKTGGLLRERDLISRRDHFRQTPGEQTAYLARRGITPKPNALIISLFSYENSQLASWLNELDRSPQPVCLLVPQGRILADIQSWLAIDTLNAGDHHQRGALDIHILPFSTQDDYDQLLWCCHFNIVRGEDSFVRAQWAGQPLLWHIYQQEDDAHLIKLNAFLDLYTADLSEPANLALRQLWLDWNNTKSLRRSWPELIANWPEIEENARKWCEAQAALKNISHSIVTFSQERILFTP